MHLWPWHWMEVGGQLHVLATLPLTMESMVPIGWEGLVDSGAGLGMVVGRRIPNPFLKLSPIHLTCGLVTVLTELSWPPLGALVIWLMTWSLY